MKPRLTDKVLRGLLKISSNPPLVEVLNGISTSPDVAGHCDSCDLYDARTAGEWVRRMIDWRAKQKLSRLTERNRHANSKAIPRVEGYGQSSRT